MQIEKKLGLHVQLNSPPHISCLQLMLGFTKRYIVVMVIVESIWNDDALPVVFFHIITTTIWTWQKNCRPMTMPLSKFNNGRALLSWSRSILPSFVLSNDLLMLFQTFITSLYQSFVLNTYLWLVLLMYTWIGGIAVNVLYFSMMHSIYSWISDTE